MADATFDRRVRITVWQNAITPARMLGSVRLLLSDARSHRRRAHAPRLLVVVALAASTILGGLTGFAHADSDRDCRTVTFPVDAGTIAGTLCLPAGPASAVLVLTAGSAANSSYWDFPYQPETYSFARAMNAAGYATLALDRLGNGQSSRPPFWAVTATGDAAGVHTAVQALRRGIPGVTPFDTVVLGGNALGSGVSVLEAGTYQDVDGTLMWGCQDIRPDRACSAV